MKRKLYRTVGIVAALGLLSGCFGGAGEDGSEAGAGSGDGSPRYGGTLVIGDEDDGPSLDPHAEVVYRVHQNVSATYSKLIEFDHGPDAEFDNFDLTPDLAESWEESEDGLTYTFHLRDDVTWHDIPPVNGRPFVADDVVATMERINEMGHQAYLIEPVESIEAPDDHTVVFTLSEPYAPFMQNMAHNYMWILPREATEGEFDPATQAIGTGPFIIEEYAQGESLLRVANPDYFVEGRPYLDEIQTIRVSESGSRLSAFQTGELDILNELGISQADIGNLEETVEGVQIKSEPGLSRIGVNMRGDTEPFDDVRVRKAISHAIDRESMGEALRVGGVDITGPLSPSMDVALTPEEVLELVPYDPDLSRDLLAEAGYEDGFSTSMDISPQAYGEVYLNEAQWIQQDLADVGIDVELVEHDWGTFVSDVLRPSNFEMSYGIRSPLLEPNEVFANEYHSDGSQQYGFSTNPELDQMIEEQAHIIDPEERAEAIREIELKIIEDVRNPAMMYGYRATQVLQPEVMDYYPHISRAGRPLMDVWLDE